jgi:transposase-like protein
MSTQAKPPASLIEAIRHFSDLDVCTEFVAELRWPDGPFCPRCGSVEYSYLTTRRIWKCKDCQRQYSVKVGTIFEDSKLGLDKWLPAVWLAANSKNGISSHELGRALGVTQKSAWFMLHRIRLAMQTKSFLKLSGEVEADETFIGGKTGNKHPRKKQGKPRGGPGGKTPVFGVKERDGRIHAEVVPDVKGDTLKPKLVQAVEQGSSVYTDQSPAYRGLEGFGFDHATVNHAERYVDGRVHTNGLENFWALLKRGLSGTYVSVDPDHLFRYVDERVFAYNLRHHTDFGRFSALLGSVADRRLTYSDVISSR